jgi:hypothetical protein
MGEAMIKDREITEGEVVTAVSVSQSPRSVNTTPKQLRQQMQRDQELRAVINEYIKNNMVVGKDYGTITISGKESKPSLFKPGAEKFCGLFKIRPTFKRDNETVEMLGSTPGILAYICELVDSQGRVMGEGRGTASVDPKGRDFDVNKQVKIAQKRAQIDAVLRTGGLSDFFTQDLEDAPKDDVHAEYPATDKQRTLINKKLTEIGVSPGDQKGFLIEEFGVTVPLTKEGASFVIGELLGSRA